MAWAYGAGAVGTATASNSVSFTGPAVSGQYTLGVVATVRASGRTVSTMTWGGVAMTSAASIEDASSNSILQVFYIVNPSSSASIVFTVSGTTSTSVIAIADYYTGIKQDVPIGASGAEDDGSAAPSITITTTKANSLFYAAYAGTSAYNDANQAAGDGLTERGFGDTATGFLEVHAETADKATTTAGSYTGSWSSNGGLNHKIIAVEFFEPTTFIPRVMIF